MPHTDDKTVLLLHCDGNDNGTSFVDSCATPKTITRANAVTKTGIKKFGTASGFFDVDDCYLSTPHSSDWIFTDKGTIDFWVYLVNTQTHINWYCVRYLDQSNVFAIGCGANSTGMFLRNDSDYYSFGTLNIGQWHHLAFVKESTTLSKTYNNGILEATINSNINAKTLNTSLWIGSWINGGSAGLNSYLDEYRISKGVARWTTEFTPPSEPYYFGVPAVYISGNRNRLHKKGVSLYNQLV